MKIKTSMLLIMFLFTFFILNTNEVKALNENNLYYSKMIYDSKQVLSDIAYLGNDYLYVVNSEGQIKKRIVYTDFVRDTYLNNEKAKLTFEVINDVDHKGSFDFLVILTDTVNQDLKSITLLSYEDEKIIWNYQPHMTSQEGFQYPVGVTDYVIKGDDLYLTYGYYLEQINLKTQSVTKQYFHDNNIWSVEVVNDMNQDGLMELAIATQSSKVDIIDGTFNDVVKSYDYSSDLDLTLNNDTVFKRNIWDLKYNDFRHTILLALENGYVYELNLDHDTVLKKEVFNGTTTAVLEYYRKYVENNSNVEKSSGIHSILYKNMSIELINNNDYIVNFGEFVSFEEHDLDQYKTCSLNSDTCSRTKQNTIKVFDEYIAYKKLEIVVDEFGDSQSVIFLYIENRYTDEVLLKIKYTDSFEDFYVLGNNIFFVTRNGLLNYVDNALVWTLDYSYETKIELQGSYLIYSDRLITNRTVGLKVINQVNEKIIDYYPDESYIWNYDILNDHYLYLIEKMNEGLNYNIKVFNLNTSDTYNFVDDEIYRGTKVFMRPYQDVNDDGVTEFLIFKEQESHITYSIVDVVNNQVIEDKSFISNDFDKAFILDVVVVDDYNEDDRNDILIMSSTAKANYYDFYMITSSSGTYFNEILKKTFYNEYEIYTIEYEHQTDLNQDGTKEYLFDINANKKLMLDFNDLSKPVFLTQTNDEEVVLAYEMDYNHDGELELATIIVSNKSYYLNLYNYTLGELQLSNATLIDYQFNVNDYNMDNVMFYDVNGDDVDEFIISAYDKYNNTEIIVFDLIEKTKDVIPILNVDETNRFTRNLSYFIKEVRYNDQNYFLILSDKLYVIDSETKTLQFALMDLNITFFNNEISTIENGQFKTKDITNNNVLEKSVSGLFKNKYHFTLANDENIAYVNIVIDGREIRTMPTGVFDLSLSKGTHNIEFEVVTRDGLIYYFNEEIDVYNPSVLIYVGIGLITIAFIGLVIGVNKLTNKRFYKR